MSNIVNSTKENWLVIKEQAEAVKKAGLLPNHVTSEMAAIIVLKGQELGIPTMRALQGMYVINGKVAMDANLIMSLIRERCPKAKLTFKRKDDKGCIIEATRPGQEPELFQFLEVDAKRAGLLGKGPWNNYPTAMYWSRTVTMMGRQLFSDILGGASYSAEELGGENEAETDNFESVSELSNSYIQPSIETIEQPPTIKPEDLLSIKKDISRSQSKNNMEETQTVKGSKASSLNERLKNSSIEEEIESENKLIPQASSMSVVAPPVSSRSNEPILVEQNTPKFEEPKKQEISPWLRLATSGPNTGKTLKQIYDDVGKDAFINMFFVSTEKIAKMNKEGKIIPQNTYETYRDLEACCKELGVA